MDVITHTTFHPSRVCGSRPGSRMVVKGGGSGSGSVSGRCMESRVGVRSYGKDSRRVIKGGAAVVVVCAVVVVGVASGSEE